MEALSPNYESALPYPGKEKNLDMAKATFRVRHVAELIKYTNDKNKKTNCSASAQIGLSRRRCIWWEVEAQIC